MTQIDLFSDSGPSVGSASSLEDWKAAGYFYHNQGVCKRCGAPIYWMVNRRMPQHARGRWRAANLGTFTAHERTCAARRVVEQPRYEKEESQ